MSMDISGPGNRPPVDTAEGTQNANRKGAGTADSSSSSPASATAGDTFSLTNKASQLQQLEAQIADLPVVDAQRVEDVQHAITTNTLQSEPAEVADKLLSFEVGLAEPGNT
jgi:negative regulator of flagellin synthesis FlgM